MEAIEWNDSNRGPPSAAAINSVLPGRCFAEIEEARAGAAHRG
jgi:hypothetical protein